MNQAIVTPKQVNVWFVFLVIFTAKSIVLAQTNTENFAQFEFNFNNPGARAIGIGGAFISIADDATSAEANPAGLTTLTKPELSFEIKGIGFTQNIHFFSNTGKDFKTSVVSPSFASLVYPSKNFVFSLFRHELVNYENKFFTRGAPIPNYPGGSTVKLFPVNSATDMKIVNLGATGAIKLSKNVSIGASFGLSKMNLTSILDRYQLEIFDPLTLANSASIDGSDSDLFFNLGIILKPSNMFSIGAIYKKRPTFSVEHKFSFGTTTQTKTINFNVPSSFGLGLSYRPTDAWTFAFDAVRVNYSVLTNDFVLTISDDRVLPNDYAAENGTEFHFGAEYVTFAKNVGIVFRGGAFTEPDNRIHWTGEGSNRTDNNRLAGVAVGKFLYREGESDFHYTFGLGILPSKNFQLDVAGNMSKGSDEAVASCVVRF